MGKHYKRVTKLNDRIQAMRPEPTAAAGALAHFRATGELPAHGWLAEDVVHRTLSLPRPVSLREQLLREAVSDLRPVRDAARFVLRALIQSGLDVGSRNFLDEDMEPPAFGSLGLYLLGWPEILIRPPYEEQAKRVLQDHVAVRRRVADSDHWLRQVARGASDFFQSGSLPEDADLRDLVICFAEFLSLHAILGREQDDALLAVFDWVGTTAGEERERAIERLQEVAREGRAP